jgi:hypothetical protein
VRALRRQPGHCLSPARLPGKSFSSLGFSDGQRNFEIWLKILAKGPDEAGKNFYGL